MAPTIRLASGIAALSSLLLLTVGAQAAEPYGTWVRPSTGSQVSFYACGGKLCARVTAVKEAGAVVVVQPREEEAVVTAKPFAASNGAPVPAVSQPSASELLPRSRHRASQPLVRTPFQNAEPGVTVSQSQPMEPVAAPVAAPQPQPAATEAAVSVAIASAAVQAALAPEALAVRCVTESSSSCSVNCEAVAPG